LALTELEVLPLKMLLAFTPLNLKLFDELRCPFAKIFWFPKPGPVRELLSKSAFTPGLKIASCVKLSVPRGMF
jgi:hypothetical protein